MAIDYATLNTVQKSIWEGYIPLQISLAPSESRTFDRTDPYLISYPRISYLPSLLTRLKAFFTPFLIDSSASQPHEGWFSFEGVPLKWHYPVGLLYDLYAGAEPATKSSDINTDDSDSPETGPGPLPWRLVVHFSDWPDDELVRLDSNGMVMNDAFINSVKEADFVRNGNAKGIMSLSKGDSAGLWRAVQDVDLPSYQRIMNILLPSTPHQPLRNLPIRLFLPLPPKPDSDSDSPFLKVVQSPIPPTISAQQHHPSQSILLSGSRASVSSPSPGPQVQTIGTALNSILPHLFPSRRTPVLAKPVLHGAQVPMSAPVEEVVRGAAYGDGWVYIVVRMMG
ncbi:autophagy protein 5 [Aspergillus stella-maris]|uniref:autophagy protein 5 n=1 Tax=Aspergillus stella-maris TaxID=1810926 RepID=UPI003CCE3D19